jgi:hypothetical protein
VPTANPSEDAQGADTVRQSLWNLERYAGWLPKGFAPSRVRDGIKALGGAIAGGGNVFACAQALEEDIDKLGAGGIATLLRNALRSLRRTLGHTAH